MVNFDKEIILQKLSFFNSDEFLKMLFDYTKQAICFKLFGERMISTKYVVEDEFLEPHKNTNPIVAFYVTAQARIKLYSYLEMLKERVLSFYFKRSRNSNWMLPGRCDG